MNTRTVLWVFFLFTLVFSCKKEVAQDPANLVGYWEIREAYRNGQPTESLDELFFEFFQDGTMRTNISGIPSDAEYSLNNNQIQQRKSEMDIDYTVQELSDSTLSLATTIRDFNFRFLLNKRIPQE